MLSFSGELFCCVIIVCILRTQIVLCRFIDSCFAGFHSCHILSDILERYSQKVGFPPSASIIKCVIYPLIMSTFPWCHLRPCLCSPIAAFQEAAQQRGHIVRAARKSTLGTGPYVQAVNQGLEKWPINL